MARPHAASSGTASEPAADNIRTIVELEARARRAETRGERLGRRISAVIGSIGFVSLQVAAMVGWVGWNSWAAPRLRFDPYPYGLLTFLVSLEGVLIATFVLIAQNQLSRESDERDHLNLQVDLLAEQEMTVVLRLLRRIGEHIGVAPDAETKRVEQFSAETDVVDIAEKLREELPSDK